MKETQVFSFTDILAQILNAQRLLVCVGSGGVGKTSISACLGLYRSLLQRESLVITIDPAKRLAHALGLESLTHTPQRVPVDLSFGLPNKTPYSVPPLSAMMMDMTQAFYELIQKEASQAQLQALLKNRLYLSMSQSMAGIQEYMAVAKLDEIAEQGHFDTVVLDTPPTIHALDFLQTPRKFIQFFDHEALQWIVKSTGLAGRIGLKFLNLGSSFIRQTIGQVGGGEIIREMAEFLVTFEPLFKGFKTRAHRVETLLKSKSVGFIIVTTPEKTQLREALFFYQQLKQQQLRPVCILVNRYHALPACDAWSQRTLVRIKETICSSLDSDLHMQARVDFLKSFYAAHTARIEYEHVAIHEFVQKLGTEIPVYGVYEQAKDVHDIESLYQLGQQIVCLNKC